MFNKSGSDNKKSIILLLVVITLCFIILEVAVRILAKPFEYIKNEQDLEMTYAYLKDNATLKISTLTNKDGIYLNTNYNSLPIILDGTFQDYVFTIPASGTYLKSILLESNYPADIVIDSVSIENQILK